MKAGPADMSPVEGAAEPLVVLGCCEAGSAPGGATEREWRAARARAVGRPTGNPRVLRPLVPVVVSDAVFRHH